MNASSIRYQLKNTRQKAL